MIFNLIFWTILVVNIYNTNSDNVPNEKIVFLGGSCEGEFWRTKVKEELTANRIDSFDPRVEPGKWSNKNKKEEDLHKKMSEFSIFQVNNQSYGLISTLEVYQLGVKGKRVFAYFETNENEIKWAAGTDSSKIFSFRNELKRICEVEQINNVYFFNDMESLMSALIKEHKERFKQQ